MSETRTAKCEAPIGSRTRRQHPVEEAEGSTPAKIAADVCAIPAGAGGTVAGAAR